MARKLISPLSENRKIEIEIGMHFDALLEEH